MDGAGKLALSTKWKRDMKREDIIATLRRYEDAILDCVHLGRTEDADAELEAAREDLADVLAECE